MAQSRTGLLIRAHAWDACSPSSHVMSATPGDMPVPEYARFVRFAENGRCGAMALLLSRIRSSPTYLYLKCYLICTLVTLFAARPVSSRLNVNGAWLWPESNEPSRPHRRQSSTSATASAEGGTPARPAERRYLWWHPIFQARTQTEGTEEASPGGERRFPFPFPFALPPPQLPLNLPPPMRLPQVPWLQRWRWRLHDMAQLRTLMARDLVDRDMYPELDWDAQVRCSPDLHPDEQRFIRVRQKRIASTRALAKFLGLPPDEEVHPDDVPLIAIGGSGGGYRALYGYAAFLKEAESTGLWQCVTWSSGVSGSCWTLAAYYTIANCSTEVLIAHLLAMANEEAHPMSIQAMDRVARSSRGIYYLLAPLLRKAKTKGLKCRLMDFYATLVTSYQFLPRPLALFGTDESYNATVGGATDSVDVSTNTERRPYRPTEGLSRSSFQWSKVWQRARLDEGAVPLPVLTGVRRVWRPPPKQRRNERVSVVQQDASDPQAHPPESLSGQASRDAPSEPPPLVGSGYDWYEVTPLELGSRDVSAWIPTWSYGRTFENGRSKDRLPEISLSAIVGQCTGAPAGPLTAYITTMLASIPQGTVMSTILSWVNEFVKMKQWEKRWGNPIRAADEPNPFYGRGMDDHVVVLAEGDTGGAQSPVDGRVLGTAHPATPRRKPGSVSTPRPPDSPEPFHTPRSTLQNGSVESLEAPHEAGKAGPSPLDTPYADAPEGQGADAGSAAESARGQDRSDMSRFDPRYYFPQWQWGERSGEHRARGERGGEYRARDLFYDALENPWGQVFSKLPKLPEFNLGEISLENPLRRRRSDSSLSSTSQRDPDSFMATFEERADLDALDDTLDDSPPVYGEEPPPECEPRPARTHKWRWEHSKRLRLMDSGLSNNLPNHVLAREERQADVIISFDTSSDVKGNAAVARLHEFADQCNLYIHRQGGEEEAQEPTPPKRARSTPADDSSSRKTSAIRAANAAAAEERNKGAPIHEWEQEADRVREQFEHRYAQRFDAWRRRKDEHLPEGEHPDRNPDLHLIYCPLFPNAAQPGFDPTTAHYSTSYNLVWTTDQVRALLRTAMANVEEGSRAIHVIRETVRDAYETKKARRLARQRT